MTSVGKAVLLGVFSLLLSLSTSITRAQDNPQDRPIKNTRSQADEPRFTEKEKRRIRAAAARERTYQRWLDEDALWISTDQERADFNKLSNNEQRDKFIEDFWDRRNPTPQSSENPYKEEHYRRIADANTHFAAGPPGYRTDRGRFYIMYGPPDWVDSKPGLTPPWEAWHYMLVEGIGRNVVLTFADKCVCGKYQLSGMDSDSRSPQIFDPLRY
jgi:GWxTD domain-containing protein